MGFGTSTPSEQVHLTKSAKINNSLIFGSTSSLPVSPQIGEILFDGNDNNLKFYNGTT
ncbi:MAG: hypothetical protein JXR51_16455 [Bacteroidales bacterium]|nr:hypothetical protein [Bacteroidales bacterium]MBN2758759.1 hypothetical protein [Bacteroidales bacterium]